MDRFRVDSECSWIALAGPPNSQLLNLSTTTTTTTTTTPSSSALPSPPKRMATAVYSEPDQMLRSAPSTSRTNKGSLKEVKNVLLSIHLDALLDFVDEQANKQLWKRR